MATTRQATIADLYKEPGKAELVEGRIVRFMPTGFLPGFAARQILIRLALYTDQMRKGYALGDNIGFLVDLPNRKSFSPDVAFFVGKASGMKWIEGAPAFAVEVRSDNDYGPKAETAIAQKRADYFAAGTQLVWDVDMLSSDVIRAYQAKQPETFEVFRRGDMAHAEPVVPGWTLAVDDLFPYTKFQGEWHNEQVGETPISRLKETIIMCHLTANLVLLHRLAHSISARCFKVKAEKPSGYWLRR
jgi:Uma2 family endonuclease